MSDLLVNTNRGLLAEFLVARALGDQAPIRDAWRPYDVLTPDGVKVEVRSGSFIQAWYQKEYTTITFGIQPTTAWDPRTAAWVGQRCRQADVYVFALLAHKDQDTIDPTEGSQWLCYPVPTRLLDRECAQAKSVSLARLLKLGAVAVDLSSLPDAVRAAANFR